MSVQQPQRGFTLVELMITVAILAVLATIAYPTYRRYVLMGRMEAARVHMIDNVRQMEHLYAQSSSFVCTEQSANTIRACVGQTGKAPLVMGPEASGDGKAHDDFYTFEVLANAQKGADAYWVLAQATNEWKRSGQVFSEAELSKQRIHMVYSSGNGSMSKCTQAGLEAMRREATAAKPTSAAIDCEVL